MQWTTYILLGLVGGGIFFAAAAFALHWSSKNGQLSNFEEGARSIFDEEEPEGQMTDHFPAKQVSKREHS